MISLSLKHRMEIRPKEVFAHNIEDFSEREHVYSHVIRIHFTESGHPCNVIDWGIDGSGRLILGKLGNYNADKKFIFKNETFIFEIKTISPPGWDKVYMTFKSFLWREYTRANSRVIVATLDGFYLFTLVAQNLVIDNIKERAYGNFANGKLAYRLHCENNEDGNRPVNIKDLMAAGLLIYRKWTPKAKAFVEKNKAILIRDKREED